MNLYSITNRTSGLHLGTFLGMDAADAIEAMACDAGYESQAHAADALGTTVEALNADLVVAEYDAADDVAGLARMMVKEYRVCGDDLTAADMIDDNAHHADDWDRVGVGACGVTAGLRPDLVEAIWQQHRDDLRDAYVAAWRAAVELELSSRDEVAS